MKDMELTAKQIKEMDENCFDRKAAGETLRIAMTYHSNQMNKILQNDKAWWNELIAIHDLDRSINWTIDNTGPLVRIVKKEEKED